MMDQQIKIETSESFPGLKRVEMDLQLSLPSDDYVASGESASDLVELTRINQMPWDERKEVWSSKHKEINDHQEVVKVPCIIYYDPDQIDDNYLAACDGIMDDAIQRLTRSFINSLIGDSIVYPQRILMKDLIESGKKIAILVGHGVSQGERPTSWQMYGALDERVDIQKWCLDVEQDSQVGLILVSSCNRKEDKPYMLYSKTTPVIHSKSETGIQYQDVLISLRLPLNMPE